MKRFYILFIALFSLNVASSQPCLPEGITFSTQTEIDNFQTNYPNCTEIEGHVTISGNNITNLNGLNILTSIGGYLQIEYNEALSSLTGLDNLTSIGDYLRIFQNVALTNLTGLENLTSIGGHFSIGGNHALTNLTGLNSLTSIGDYLYIGYNEILTNLTGLNSLTSIGDYLYIIFNEALTSLTGLDNLTSIGGDLHIDSNFALISLMGLENLTSIGGNIEIYANHALTSLTGLKNIDAGSIFNLSIYSNTSLSICEVQSICDYLSNPEGVVNIYDNATGCNSVIEVAGNCGISLPCLPYGDYCFSSQADIDNFQSTFPHCTELAGNVTISGSDITNLNGLNALTYIGGNLLIQYNEALTNLEGLDNMTYIDGDLIIYFNLALTNLTGLDNLNSIGGSFEIRVNSLTSLTGLNNLTSIAGYLDISFNLLTNLTGLDNLTFLGGYLNFNLNSKLTSLSGLDNLASLGGGLLIICNPDLTSLSGLDNLNSIGGLLDIEDNRTLTSLTGLNNLTSIGGYMWIGLNDVLTSLKGLDNMDAGSITELHINYNYSLSTCDIQSVCDYLVSPDAIIEIHDNAVGCNSQAEVESACGVGYKESNTSENQLCIYPNPSYTQITIETPTTPFKNTFLTIYNINGQQIISQQIMEETTVIDVNTLPRGIYIVKVTDDRTVMVGKFIRQ